MTPINPKPVHHTEGGHHFSNVFRKTGELLARFFGNDHKTNAEEFCDYWFDVTLPSGEVDLPNARPVIDMTSDAVDEADYDDF